MSEEMLKTTDVVFEYEKYDEEGNVTEVKRAVDDVSLQVKKGDFIAILGHNGSGKSTLAKHINAILLPKEGEVVVDGMNTKDDEHLWDIRQNAGMVFQNPDNQIIGTVVEEDVGFGPENMGVPTEEIWQRVGEALQAVGMVEYRKHSPNKLSGGQKQRVAIAGVVAMHPQCIILDEPTAMLDPNGRKEVIRTVRKLNEVENITVILITHYMEEVIHANRVIVMDEGKVVMEGTPREIFSKVETLKHYRLDVPQVTLLAYELQKKGLNLPNGILTTEEFVEELLKIKPEGGMKSGNRLSPSLGHEKKIHKDVILDIQNISYIYSQGTAYEIKALDGISLKIHKGEFIGLIGHTGSGKSTFVQHLNGLVKATEGKIQYNGQDIYAADYSMNKLRTKVGLVFQYPEHQLFETDVLTDVSFGPRNQGLSVEEAKEKAKQALARVGVGESYYEQSPFELSGGQKRRAAIAGVLAMEPELLILDEPTAGLDPKGRDEILGQIRSLHEEHHITIILVSHSMEDVAEYVERIIVMNKGKLAYDDEPKNVFSHYKELEKIGLAAPQVTYIMHALKDENIPVDTQVTTIEEAADEIARVCGKE